jgi:hypothetical protein
MPLPPGKNSPLWLLYHQEHNPVGMVILLQSLRDQFSSLYMGLHSEVYDRWAKDSCADLDCIRLGGARPYLPIVYNHIVHIAANANVAHASEVSNFAQTPDGQRRNLISNRYAIARRSVLNSTS